jgi:hypothetical protein
VKIHRARDSIDDADEDWREAGSLQTGDEVLTAGGKWQQIVSIEQQERSKQVYNFAVEDNHNYFVGQNGTLVHNNYLEIIEHTDDALWGYFKTPVGKVEFMADLAKGADRVTLSGVHVGGLEAGSLMPKQLLKQRELFAREIANWAGVKNVTINPGIRLGGAAARNGLFRTPPPLHFSF